MMTACPHIRIERDGAVLCVTFDRPDKKNALTGAMYVAATEALRQAGQDTTIGAILFAGSGGMFTAGNDIGDFLEASGEPGSSPLLLSSRRSRHARHRSSRRSTALRSVLARP